MKAVTIRPGQPQTLGVSEVDAPRAEPGQALLQTLAVGICGTDRDILAGQHGAPPTGAETLILGHECLARVLEAPAGSGWRTGQLAAPTVRRPCGRPECYPCAAGRADMCITLAYTERGIQGANGYQCERFTEWPRNLVPLPDSFLPFGMLTEPTSVVSKAIEEGSRIQASRLPWQPSTALVTGAGPVGLLAAMLLRLRHLQVTVYDRQAPDGPKARAVTALGAHYACATATTLEALAAQRRFDWIVECTGARQVVFEALATLAPAGAMCLLGVSGGHGRLEVPADELNERMVLTNGLLFGSVNASRDAFTTAAQALAAAETTWPGWLSGLITRREPPERMREAVTLGPDDIKTVVQWA